MLNRADSSCVCVVYNDTFNIFADNIIVFKLDMHVFKILSVVTSGLCAVVLDAIFYI